MFIGVTPTILRPSLLSAILKPQDVFATSAYTGNGSTSDRTIVTGFKPDLMWNKQRDAASNNILVDTLRGTKALYTNATGAEVDLGANAMQSLANGVGLAGGTAINASGNTFALWSFARASKFFDIVTWTGDGTSNRQIPHGLGVVPGMVIARPRTEASRSWQVTHRSLSSPLTSRLLLNDTGGEYGALTSVFPSAATGASLTVGDFINASGQTYVAYLFAHDPSADGIVQCGSAAIASDGSVNIALPWMPQFVLFRQSDGTDGWWMIDSARGVSPNTRLLRANLSNAETNGGSAVSFSASGAAISAGQFYGAAGTLICLAIRAPY